MDADQLRFLLQTNAHTLVSKLSPQNEHYIQTIGDLLDNPQMRQNITDEIKAVFSDLCIGDTLSKPGTTLYKLNQLLDPPRYGASSSPDFVIQYDCADRCVDPVIISTPPEGSTDARIHVNTSIFCGFPSTHYNQLRQLGIERVMIINQDNEILTDQFQNLDTLRMHTNHSTMIEPEISDRAIVILGVLLIIFLIVTHRIVI